jgi:hypothetical protein
MTAHEISAVKEKPFWKDYIFRKFLIVFSTAFLGPQALVRSFDIINFRKSRLLLKNNLGKPLRKCVKTYHFMSGFPKLFYG